MVKSKLPVKEARPLIEIPVDIPQIGFFGGEQGKEINEAIRRDYGGFKVLQVGNYSEGVVEGSNPFFAVAVQSRLPSGISIATQVDLENAMRIGAMDFRGTYEDTGLVLRTDEKPNSYLSRNLMKQVKARSRKKMPVMIPLRGLILEEDQDSPHGLSFKLTDDTELIPAQILGEKNSYFASTDINIKTGLPKKLSQKGRNLWTMQTGLSGLYLSGGLSFDSDYYSLAGSNDSGRVVLVSTAEGGSQKK